MKKYIIFDMDGTLIESSSTNLPLMYKHLKKYIPDLEYDYFVYYNIQTTGTATREQIRVLWKNTLSESAVNKIADEIYAMIIEKRDKHPFFDGVVEMIKSLHQDYTLFLSTGNSDEYAQKKMADAWINVCFNKILGSSIVFKGPDHIKMFKDTTADQDFEKYAVYLGDGNTDREIAQSHNIDFIKIWKSGIDTYEVDNTIEALKIIKSL